MTRKPKGPAATDDMPLVVARALLRSADGSRPGIDLPISAANVARLKPAAQAVASVADHFSRAGFEVLGAPGAGTSLGVGISGPKALFERHFGVELTLGADGAYTVRPVGRSSTRTPVRPDDATLIPDERLPTSVRDAISQIALEAAATLDQTRADP